MVFSSLTFIFIFLFICIVLYFILPGIKPKNAVLLIMSLIFYSWGEPRLLALLLADTVIAFAGGFLIDGAKRAAAGKAESLFGDVDSELSEEGNSIAKFYLAATIVLILAFLVYFKYFGFLTSILAGLGMNVEIAKIALPTGISFYTFQILSYVIDLYRGRVALQKNFFRLLLYVSFFPQLIAGPIVRYGLIENEISQRSVSLSDAEYAVKRFIIGLFKKLVVANGVAKVAEIIYGAMSFGEGGLSTGVYGTGFYWLAALSYTLQIYFDFSGYSDMAIALGRLFGFHFDENFNYPYMATSVQDFWSRWHISLSTFFRDYVYIPMGGNRVGKGRWIFNFLCVWLLTGLWHGASYSFILWGLYYGVILLAEKLIVGARTGSGSGSAGRKNSGKSGFSFAKIIGWVYTMLVVIVGWVFFNLDDFAMAGTALKTMFTYVPTDVFAAIAADTAVLRAVIFVPLGLLCMFPLRRLLDGLEEKGGTFGICVSNLIYILMLLLCIALCIAEKYNPFIYFRF